MFGINFGESGDLLTVGSIYVGIIFAAFWLAMIVWTYRDIRARSRDSLVQLGSAGLVALLTVPGWFIYMLLRPRETLSESYERSLEEEALLQEIEEKPSCPGCGQRVQGDWQACPHCHTRLKKSCISCGYLMELSWNLCPSCATVQNMNSQDDLGLDYTNYAQPSKPQPRISVKQSGSTKQSRSAEPVEFMDTEDYEY
ncbi:MAG: zinc ribbon domain-containing protein [Aggregatilineales bacterium]